MLFVPQRPLSNSPFRKKRLGLRTKQSMRLTFWSERDFAKLAFPDGWHPEKLHLWEDGSASPWPSLKRDERWRPSYEEAEIPREVTWPLRPPTSEHLQALASSHPKYHQLYELSSSNHWLLHGKLVPHLKGIWAMGSGFQEPTHPCGRTEESYL